MKILHVITSLRTGGAEKLMIDLLPILREKGFDVELLVFDGTSTPFFQLMESTGIIIHKLHDKGGMYSFANILALRKFLNRYDIIHTHNTPAQFFVAISHLFSGKSILVTTEHNTMNRRRGKWWWYLLDQWMYKQYSRIICISNKAEENLREYLKMDSNKILTIFNGIDVKSFHSFRDDSPKERALGQVVITMVAAFREQKDQKTLIYAACRLPNHYIVQFVGIGEQKLMDECKALVSSLNLDDRVFFLGMRNDVSKILSSSDIIVLSSHYEGLSLSCLEGMASGKPFVSSDVDGLHEIVAGYGVLFPHEDFKSLANELIKLGDDPVYSQKVAESCIERAKQFDISIMADKYMKVYNELFENQ